MPDSADVSTLPLAPVAAEVTRLEALFSADKIDRDQYAALTGRIAQENSALQTLQTRLPMRKAPLPARKTFRQSAMTPMAASSRRSSTSRTRVRAGDGAACSVIGHANEAQLLGRRRPNVGLIGRGGTSRPAP
jgi:hypothetical protein